MKYTYHYHAVIHESSSKTHLDGILTLEHSIDSYTEYNKVKKLIAEWQKPYHDQTRMIICSLTLLSEVEDKEDDEI